MFDKKIDRHTAADAADAVDIHRNAYNAAFYELGLRWHWDGKIYPSVLDHDAERARLRAYVETYQPHLLKAYDADFLIDAVDDLVEFEGRERPVDRRPRRLQCVALAAKFA